MSPSLVQTAPRFVEPQASRIVEEVYGLQVVAAPLPSERDQNFLCTTASNRRYVLKIANSAESLELLRLQNDLIHFLSGRGLGLEFPGIVPNKSGEEIASVGDDEGRTHFVRLLTWLEGDCFANIETHNSKLLASLGRGLAQMDAALAEFTQPAARRSFYWDLQSAAMARSHVTLLPKPRRAMVERFFAEWEKIDWRNLRFSIVHNDANDYNVLVNPAGRVSAILDYGDVVYSATVCDLAAALAYAMLDKPDPIRSAAHVVAAYHEAYPLNEAEIDSLYVLAATRLCMSVCYAAHQTSEAPANRYLNISNAPAWALLERLSALPLDGPTQVFRYACGLPVQPIAWSAVRRAREELTARRKEHLGPGLSLSYRSPLHIVAGSRQYLYDSDGRRYLDCVNNVAHVGHSHPFVVRAASEQMAALNTNTRYLHEKLIEYTERLAATLPEPLSVVYLVNSGSEANELALRLARAHTGNNDVIVLEAAYHGNTSALIDLSPYKFDGPGGRGCPPHVHKVPLPDVYRGPYRGPNAGDDYARAVAEVAQRRRLAAFFCESAPSCGGQIILPAGYLQAAYAAVRAAGGVCVADEVQTGFGRAGGHFWMFEGQGVVPDIVTLGKPIGNGHPLGAVITTPNIAASFANGMEYFNTFGGNPVSCAVGLAVLDVMREEELQHNAFEVGAHLMNGLRELQTKHPLMGNVRGEGLFVGIEFVRDRQTLEPADRESSQLVEGMRERGILLSIDGPHHNVLKIKPPLVFSRRDADLLLGELDHGLAAR